MFCLSGFMVSYEKNELFMIYNSRINIENKIVCSFFFKKNKVEQVIPSIKINNRKSSTIF